MSGKQRRRQLKREGNGPSSLRLLRHRFREFVLHGDDMGKVRPGVVRILNRHVDHLLSLPTSQLRKSREPSIRELEIARSEVDRLLKECNNMPFESPALLDLFAAGIRDTGLEIEPGEDAPERLIGELVAVCISVLAIELRRLEIRAKSLATHPEVFGLTGEVAEYFESFFPQYHDTIESLVQVATDLAGD